MVPKLSEVMYLLSILIRRLTTAHQRSVQARRHGGLEVFRQGPISIAARFLVTIRSERRSVGVCDGAGGIIGARKSPTAQANPFRGLCEIAQHLYLQKNKMCTKLA